MVGIVMTQECPTRLAHAQQTGDANRRGAPRGAAGCRIAVCGIDEATIDQHAAAIRHAQRRHQPEAWTLGRVRLPKTFVPIAESAIDAPLSILVLFPIDFRPHPPAPPPTP